MVKEISTFNEENEENSSFDSYGEDRQPHKMGDRILFSYGEDMLTGVVKGLAWDAGNVDDPIHKPTPISEPADNVLVSVEGKRNLMVISAINVIRNVD